MKRALSALIFVSAFFDCHESKAQTNGLAGAIPISCVSPIIRIKGAMGFVIEKNLIATVATDRIQNSDGVIVSFDSTSRPGCRPWGFDAVAKIARIDHVHSLVLLSVDTKDAVPTPLASASTEGGEVYRYFRTKTPNKNVFHGASVIYASAAANLGDDFLTIPGGPVLNVQGQVVGMTVASCGPDEKLARCVSARENLQRLISAFRSSR